MHPGDEPDDESSASRLARRLSQILFQLGKTGSVDPAGLAAELGVSLRTIQRDLNERFDFLGLERRDGRYHVAPGRLAPLSETDLDRFACLAGVRDLFPDLGAEALLQRLRDTGQSAVVVHDHHVEDLGDRGEVFGLLEFAILNRCRVNFRYQKDEGSKDYTVEPYKLVHHVGVWYLAAQHGGQLKSFALRKIGERPFLQADEHFQPDPALIAQLEVEDSIWLKPQKVTVRLRVARPAAGYFLRRPLVPGQVIQEECADGSLRVLCRVASEHQILPTVRYWMPHVQVESPPEYQALLRQQVQAFLDVLDADPVDTSPAQA